MSTLTVNSAPEPMRYGFLLLPRFNSLTLSSLVEPLRIANYCAGSVIYEWHFMSVDGAAVQTSTNVAVPTGIISADDGFDAIIVCGGWNAERYVSPPLTRWLQNMGHRGVVLGAVETGAYVLARANLLSGYAVTIHWHCQSAFRESFPGIEVWDSLFVIDRQRMTCAGGIACLDMMLHEIGRRHGRTLALEVAEQLVYSPHREANAPQKNFQASRPVTIPPELQRAIDLMRGHVEKPLSIPQISDKLGFSQRKLERLFKRHFGCSAVAYYRNVRLHEARVLLTHTDMSVLDVCIACGFASSSYFSKIYAQQFGVRPRDHRTSWPDSEPAPYWPGIASSRSVRA